MIDWSHFWSVMLALGAWITVFFWLLVVTAPPKEQEHDRKVQPLDTSDTW
jgi:hypothetical protein